MNTKGHSLQPGSLWWMQGMHLASALGVIGVWIFWVPSVVTLPADVALRIQFYPIFLIPLLAVLLAGSHLWIRPLTAKWPLLVAGKLPPGRVAELVSRAARYPYHAFCVSGVGVVVTAAAVAVVQKAAHGTDLHFVVLLFALACALGLVFALLSFFIGRIAMRSFLSLPGVVETAFQREPDLRKRVMLGAMCLALVVWIVLGVLVFDHQTRLALALVHDPVLHPSVAELVGFLVVMGLVFLTLVGVMSSLAARDISTDMVAVATGLQGLAAADVGAAPHTLPVLSPDEVGELTEAFNHLVGSISRHDQVMRLRSEQAASADLRQLEFFNIVSHDLRTPLHSIVGFSQLLIEGVEGELNAEQVHDVHNILNGAHHLLSLVDDVVDLSKMESGMMALSRCEVDMVRVVREALEAASGLLKGQEVRLVSDLPEDLPAVYADETRLRQILFNLVGNSLKFTSGGEVRVIVRQDGQDMLTVAVEDDGRGIPEASLERVFEEFEQVRGVAGTAAKGTGLGLAITRRLVEMHGGRIRAANRPAGGAVFAFSIPVMRHQGAA